MHLAIRYCLLPCVIISIHVITAQNPRQNLVTCRFQKDCGANRTCEKNFCVCSDHVCTVKDMSTKMRSFTGRKSQSCKSDADCNLENEICDGQRKICVCKEEYITSNTGSKCLQVPDKKINGTCEDKNQCVAVLENTDCLNGVCECSKGYHFAVDKCYQDRKINDDCLLNQECENMIGAKCLELKCKCPEGSFLNDNNCITNILNNACNNNETCTSYLDFAFCNNGTCKCLPLFFHYMVNNTCLQTEGELGTPCIQKDHCFEEDPKEKINILQCSDENKICECIDNYHPVENRTLGNSTCEPNSVASREINVGVLAILFAAHAFF